PGSGQPLHDRASQVIVGGELARCGRPDLVSRGREVARRRGEVAGGVTAPIACGAVADRAVVVVHPLAQRRQGALGSGRGCHGEQGDRRGQGPPDQARGYSRTRSWPTTCAGCRWHLMGKIPDLSALKVTSLDLLPSTTSLTLNAAIS